MSFFVIAIFLIANEDFRTTAEKANHRQLMNTLRLHPGNTKRAGSLSTVDLLIRVVCFVKR